MKKLLLLLVTITSFTMFTQVAEAKRFGGGKSMGFFKKMPSKKFGQKQSSNKAQKPAAASSAAGKAGAASGASKWLGPLAGLAAGGLLAAMIFGDGFDGIQMFDILLFALIAFMLFKIFGRKRAQYNQEYASQGDQYAGHDTEDHVAGQNQQAREVYQADEVKDYSQTGSIIGSAVSGNAQPITHLPSWFDEASFVENAKSHFVSVQKAWDAADVKEIESYCSEELFAALSAEMAGMKAGDNHTEVDELNVEFVDAVIDGEYLVVSVRFTGYIIEEQGADSHAFSEIWHIRRLEIGEGNWQISGIQQP
jgi:predicted lipid-binding transport protein (Tim44 family)